MKNKGLKILVAVIVVNTIILTVSAVKASAEWVQDSGSNWSYTENGTNSIGWKQVDGIWYHFDNNGKMQTGWVKAEDSKWYYMNTDGSMKTGWLKDTNGTWYDLASSGEMKTGWVQDTDGKQYFLSSSGAMQTGVVDVEGSKYALDKNGAKLIGNNVVCESNQYTTDVNGVITVGAESSNGAKKFTNEGVPVIPTATYNASTEKTTSTATSESNAGSSNHHHSNSTTVVTPPAPVLPTAILVSGSTNATATIQFNEELYWKDSSRTLIKNIDYDMMTLPEMEVPFQIIDFAGNEVSDAITSAVYSVADKKITFTFNPGLIKSNGYKLKFLGENYDAAGNALIVPSDKVVAIYEDGTWTTKPSDPPKASLAANSTNTTATINFSEELYWDNEGILTKNIDFDMMKLEGAPFKVVDGDDAPVDDAIISANYSASDRQIVFTFDSSKIVVGSKLIFLGKNYDSAGNELVVPSNSVVANFDGTTWTTKSVPVIAKLTVTAAKGTAIGTTVITATASTGNSLVYKISNIVVNKPNIGDTVTGTNPLVSGNDISGVDATNNKYIAVYELESSNKVVSFKLITLTADNIKSESVAAADLTTLELDHPYPGTTKINVKLNVSDPENYDVIIDGAPTRFDPSTKYFSGMKAFYYTSTQDFPASAFSVTRKSNNNA